MVVHTLGHSTLTFVDFLALLEAHAIAVVADVRRFPASRRHPHFNREALAAALPSADRPYCWLPELGGRRTGRPGSPHVAWQNTAFRAYADHMETPDFAAGLVELLDLARQRPTTILCAEAVPWRCHRQLIADALVVRGIEVRHIVSQAAPAPHRLTAFARLEGDRVLYDRGQLGLDGT